MSRPSVADSQGTRLHFRVNHILSSKRLRIVFLGIAVVLLILWSTTYLGGGVFTSGFHSSTRIHSANSSNVNADWSRFAYIQYATNTAYLCNSLMLFESLHRFENRADRLLMYPSIFHLQKGKDESTESRLLKRARDRYHVKLAPIDVQHTDNGDGKPYEFHHWDIILKETSRHLGRKLHQTSGFQSNSV